MTASSGAAASHLAPWRRRALLLRANRTPPPSGAAVGCLTPQRPGRLAARRPRALAEDAAGADRGSPETSGRSSSIFGRGIDFDRLVACDLGDPSSSSSSWTHEVTVATANMRGGELTDAKSGVWIALFDVGGRCCVTHVVKPDDEYAFDRGSVEAFKLRAPELGETVDRVWIGPARGTWFPERVTVASSSSSTTFRNAAILGERQDAAASELLAFDAEEDERERRLASAEDAATFAETRRALLVADLVLVCAGAAAVNLRWGETAAANFACGGLIGLSYLLLLSSSVASIGRDEDSAAAGGARRALDKVLSLSGTRVLLVGAACFLLVRSRAEGAATEEVLPTILEAVAGLLTYKVAVLGVSVLNRGGRGSGGKKGVRSLD